MPPQAGTFSYNPTLVTNKDIVRRLIGDVRYEQRFLADEEIAFFLADENNVYMAAAAAAEAIAAEFARLADNAVAGFSISLSLQSKKYFDLADRLRKRRGYGHQVPSAGGIEATQREDFLQDTTLVPRAFRTDQFENPPGFWSTTDRSDEPR